MNTKPIIFSAPMIRALLGGRKTQTRRIVKPQPYGNGFHFDGHYILCHCDELPPDAMLLDVGKGRNRCTTSSYEGWESACPYGMPGDLLWVREACAEPTSLDPGPTFFRADYPACVPSHFENVPPIDRVRWKPSIHMRRDQSRLTLQITDVRVQRLQDISEADAKEEGARLCAAAEAQGLTYRSEFSGIWTEINGPESWDANPWVWALSFRVIHANVDAVLAYPAAHGAEVRNAP